jgi:hypothetical protein
MLKVFKRIIGFYAGPCAFHLHIQSGFRADVPAPPPSFAPAAPDLPL